MSLIALIGACIVAVTAMIGSIVASNISAGSQEQSARETLSTTREEATADRMAATEAARRAQRQQAYEQLTSANRRLTDAEQDVLIPDRDADLTRKQALKAVLQRREDFRLAVDVVRVAGPEDATLSSRLDDFIHLHEVLRHQIEDFKRRQEVRHADRVRYGCAVTIVLDTSAGLAPFLSEVLEAGDTARMFLWLTPEVGGTKTGPRRFFTHCKGIDESKVFP